MSIKYNKLLKTAKTFVLSFNLNQLKECVSRLKRSLVEHYASRFNHLTGRQVPVHMIMHHCLIIAVALLQRPQPH